jgi:surfeit locus 1 family protein
MHHYRFDWKLTLLTGLLLPLLLCLGFWQLQRGNEKAALQNSYAARQQEAAVPLSTLDPAQDLQYRQVLINGHYDNEHVFLLDNRSYQGQSGYEVIVPLVTDDNGMVLVNRGWIAAGQSRQILPAITPVEGNLTVQGSVYQNVGTQVVLGSELETAGWPKVMETLEPVRMAALAGATDKTRVFPYSVRVAENAPGALLRFWPVISMSPERHRGYAAQWFLMALALAALYFFYSTRIESKADSQSGHEP